MASSKGIRTKDQVKEMVLQSVQHHIVAGKDRPPLAAQPDNVDSVEGHIINPAETLIRVVTRDKGTRYFRVIVREMM